MFNNKDVLYANPQSREALKAKVREIFQLFDADGSGDIDAKEFHELVFAMGEIMSDEEAAKYLAVLDKDGNGSISFDEFFEWWCKKDTNTKNYSTDKLKEIKSKLQSANLMRSVTYLMKKAKENLHAEKEVLKSSSSAIAAPAPTNNNVVATSTDPDAFAADVSVDIGIMKPENAKIHARVAYDELPNNSNCARFEFLLKEGTSAEESGKIKSLFDSLNGMMGGSLFKTASYDRKDGAHPSYVAEFTFSEESAFAKQGAGMIKMADLSKLQFDLFLSQSLEEIDLKDLALRFGIRLEISAATVNMLSKKSPLGGLGFLSALRNVVFQLRFANLQEAAEKFTAKSFQSKLKLKKDDIARKFQDTIKMFGQSFDLPIKEISKINLQVENHGFTLQFTGLDVSFLFVEVPEPTFLDQFNDVQPIATSAEEQLNFFAPPGTLAERFTAKVSQFGEDMDVEIIKTKVDDLELYKETVDRLNEVYGAIAGRYGSADYIDDFKAGVYDGHVYEVRRTYPGWKTLRQWMIDERIIDGPSSQRLPFAEIEGRLRKIILHFFELAGRFGWDWVSHGLTIDMFIINPLTEDLKCVDWLNFRRRPSTTIPSTAIMLDMPPETYTTVGEYSNEDTFDVWVVGVEMYKLFTGYNVPVFTGQTTEEKIANIIACNYNKEAPEFQSLPQTAQDLIGKLLKEKDERMGLFFHKSFDPWLNPERQEN